MSRITRLGALRMVDPKAWAAEVRAALKDSNGFLDEAAEKLEVSRRQLQRWLAADDMPETVSRMVAEPHRHRPKPTLKARRK